eukprot:11848046-Alexandrium_andersonii.AAC.1
MPDARPTAVPSGAAVQLGNRPVHESHRLAHHRGLWWCWACGCVGSVHGGSWGLTVPCGGAPSLHGVETLSRLRRGM